MDTNEGPRAETHVHFRHSLADQLARLNWFQRVVLVLGAAWCLAAVSDKGNIGESASVLVACVLLVCASFRKPKN